MEDTSQGLLTAELDHVNDETAVLRLSGEIDLSSVHVLGDQFEAIVAQHLPDVIVDATAVTFMDSTGLHALVEGKRALHESGTRIYLVPSSQVRRVLELVFPDPLFASRVDSVDDALAAIERGSAET
jgi:anti-sigma B factor antagonist